MMVPNKALPPAVAAIIQALQSVTRTAPTATPAPPTRGANVPKILRNSSEVPATRMIRLDSGASAAIKRGMAAPDRKAAGRCSRRLNRSSIENLGDAVLVAGIGADRIMGRELIGNLSRE
jgi:hypothetical protein